MAANQPDPINALLKLIVDYILQETPYNEELDVLTNESFSAIRQIIRGVETAAKNGKFPSKQRREAIRSFLVVDVENLEERRAAVLQMVEDSDQFKGTERQRALILIATAKAFLGGGPDTSDAGYAAALPAALNVIRSLHNVGGRRKTAPIKKKDAIAAFFALYDNAAAANTIRKAKPPKK